MFMQPIRSLRRMSGVFLIQYLTLLRGGKNMLPHWKTAFATALWAAACSQSALAQAPPITVIQIDTENHVRYVDDVGDPSKFATLPGPVAALPNNNFRASLECGDIE